MTPWITVREAAVRAQVAENTIVGWCKRYHIGMKIGGRYRVDPDALAAILAGRAAA